MNSSINSFTPDSGLGLEGDDDFYGYPGHDELNGNAGDNLLNGGPGSDDLYGNAGDNLLNGGPGRDKPYGGPDVDTFVLENGQPRDPLAGTDNIKLENGLAVGDLNILPRGSSTLNEVPATGEELAIVPGNAEDINDGIMW